MTSRSTRSRPVAPESASRRTPRAACPDRRSSSAATGTGCVVSSDSMRRRQAGSMGIGSGSAIETTSSSSQARRPRRQRRPVPRPRRRASPAPSGPAASSPTPSPSAPGGPAVSTDRLGHPRRRRTSASGRRDSGLRAAARPARTWSSSRIAPPAIEIRLPAATGSIRAGRTLGSSAVRAVRTERRRIVAKTHRNLGCGDGPGAAHADRAAELRPP